MGPQLDCPSDPPAETGTQTERRHAGETHTNTQESCVCVFERVREEKRREEKRREEKRREEKRRRKYLFSTLIGVSLSCVCKRWRRRNNLKGL